MATSPQYAAVPLSPAVLLSTANPNRDGTGAVVQLVAAASNGARVDDVVVQAQATTTAGMVRFFLKRGTAFFLLREVAVAAQTPSATDRAFSIQLLNLAWVLDPTSEVYVSTEKAEAIVVAVTRGGAL